ncbi:MAG: hypothetical protein DRI57_04335 [Deltaproteobacteria bacterium]|nr:MAG: hypothetical protein DRI57_04335 [Deltaproteobacteria bacterium]
MESLWPENLTVTGIKAPVIILREQASLLGDTTQNIIEAEVKRADVSPDMRLDKKNDMGFRYVFYIVAPALGNYQYKLFTIWHSVDLYPVIICPDQDVRDELYPDSHKDEIQTESENEFIEMLKAIFHSKKTGNIIQALVSQSTAP